MGMSALGIGPGDEVIMADSNWIATAAPIIHLGAKPIFVDILPDTWCIDPVEVEKAITEKTKAIIAVHLYGNLCDMDSLFSIGRKYGIPVIEDAAEAIGSTYRGKAAGSMGVFGTFSFHGSKTITTGEGGMFVTNDADLFERVLTLSNHGRSSQQSKQFWPDCVGYKYKMSNIQAAIGCAQMQRIEELVRKKQRNLVEYRKRFDGIQGLSMNPEVEGTETGAWMPTLVYDENLRVRREQIQKTFTDLSIDARVFFWPLSSLPPFGSCALNPNAKSIAKRAINLPSFHDLTTHEISRVEKAALSVLCAD